LLTRSLSFWIVSLEEIFCFWASSICADFLLWQCHSTKCLLGNSTRCAIAWRCQDGTKGTVASPGPVGRAWPPSASSSAELLPSLFERAGHTSILVTYRRDIGQEVQFYYVTAISGNGPNDHLKCKLKLCPVESCTTHDRCHCSLWLTIFKRCKEAKANSAERQRRHTGSISKCFQH
jgi:hypothetical protein